MPRAASIARDEALDEATAVRREGDFARHPDTGAPWVDHPTEVCKTWGLNKAALIAKCAERGIVADAKMRNDEIEALLGPKPKRVMYGRPSSLGKQIENTTNLQKWSERAVALGLFLAGQTDLAPLDEELSLRALEQLNLDDPDTKKLLDSIAVKAKARASAGIAAERGTHTHELTEDSDTEGDWVARVERGEDLGLPLEVQAALVAAWEKALHVFGFEILAVEATVVDDHWRQAGTLDRIVRLTRPLRFVTAHGEIVELPAGWVGILDLKTGRLRLDDNGFVAYWLSYSVQVASYGQSLPYDTATDTRGEWPFEIDQKYAVIAHLDVLAALDGEAVCRLVLVDLEAGRDAGNLCVAAREWEKRTDVFSMITGDLAVTVPVVDRGEEHGSPKSVAPPKAGGGPVSPPPPATIAAPAPPAVEQPAPEPVSTAGSGAEIETAPDDDRPSRRSALLARYQALGDADKRRFLARNIDRDDLDAVEVLLDHIEGTAARSASDSTRRDEATETGTRTPNEGGQADSHAIAALRNAYSALDPDAQTWVDSLVAQGKTAGVPWNTGGAHTVRRFELGRAVVRLAGTIAGNEFGSHIATETCNDIIRGLLEEATGREEVGQEALPLGAAIGTLDHTEAVRFAQLVDDYLAIGATSAA